MDTGVFIPTPLTLHLFFQHPSSLCWLSPLEHFQNQVSFLNTALCTFKVLSPFVTPPMWCRFGIVCLLRTSVFLKRCKMSALRLRHGKQKFIIFFQKHHAPSTANAKTKQKNKTKQACELQWKNQNYALFDKRREGWKEWNENGVEENADRVTVPKCASIIPGPPPPATYVYNCPFYSLPL